MNAHGCRRGFRVGAVALAASCATLLVATALSGCNVYVSAPKPRNPFVGEWHAEFMSAGSRFSVEYEFRSNGRYAYVRQLASRVVRVVIRTQGAYSYDGETLLLTPDADDVEPSRFRYEFTSDDELELQERISPSITLALTYHRHS